MNFEKDKTNAFVFSLEEYNEILSKVFNDTLGVVNECGEWFYVMSEDIDASDEEIHERLGTALNVNIVDVIVDISKQKVVILWR